MARPKGNLTVALSWCEVGLQQAARVRETFERLRYTRLGEVYGRSESRRLRSLFWGDVHFLMIASRHVITALEGMPPASQPPGQVRRQVELLRHQLEHWWEAQNKGGAWNALPAYATPYHVMVVGSDLRIGADNISLHDLEDFMARTRDELMEIVERTSDRGSYSP